MSKQIEKLKIDFLYLDLSTCERCGATDKVLDEAVPKEMIKDAIRKVLGIET